MTDRELLEFAAKAAGWTGCRSKHGYWNVESPEGKRSTHCHHWNEYCPNTGKKLPEPTFADAITETNWNPLTDDGDALRLAVDLEIAVWRNGDLLWIGGKLSQYEGDPYAATRRAIVRAAAEIGRTK